MHVKYRCPVKGRIRVQQSFPLPAGFIRYELDLGPAGEITHVSAVVPVTDRALWPIVKKSADPGIALDINLKSPFYEVVRQDLRSAEGMLSLFGLDEIDTESPEVSWLPDSPEEKEELRLYEFKATREKRPIEEIPFIEFDLVARTFLVAEQSRSIEVALSFFRKGKIDVVDHRFIEATYDFLFMVESMYAGGKFKTDQVEKLYLSNAELVGHVRQALAEPALKENVWRDSRMKEAFIRDYTNKSPEEVIRHIVQLRGFLHHHSMHRKDIWHPEDHARFGADAYFMQQLCFGIAFRLAEEKLFSSEVVGRYQSLVNQYVQEANSTK